MLNQILCIGTKEMVRTALIEAPNHSHNTPNTKKI
uniref:Uncharacterized protein n=1 Tax=Rhizophora mucronata TaxID=61149 RepID=A0A2P2IP83_RHIMU